MGEVPLSEPTLHGNETRYLEECVRTTFVSSVGPFVRRFEEEFATWLGGGHAVACASGTAALHLALIAVGVEPGDEVFVSDLTFIASANAAVYSGASVTLVDSERDTWNLDGDLVREELARRAHAGEAQPKAVVAVHVLGQAAQLAGLCEDAREYGVALVEDAAEALGARWCDEEHGDRPVGTIGAAGCYSFNGNKIITTGGGGMVWSADPALAARVKHLSTQAKLPGAEYHHDAIGFNYRLSNLAAAVGVAQLERLDELVAARAIAARYDAGLAGIDGVTTPPNPVWATRTGWMYSILLPDRAARDALQERLAADGIAARPIWVPLHQQAPYAKATVLGGGQVGDDLAARALTLPCSAHLDPADQDRVIEVVRRG